MSEKDIQYKIGTPYNGHTHYDAHKALMRRLNYLTDKIDNESRPERLSYMKAEKQAIHYALECLEFTKVGKPKSKKSGK